MHNLTDLCDDIGQLQVAKIFIVVVVVVIFITVVLRISEGLDDGLGAAVDDMAEAANTSVGRVECNSRVPGAEEP